MLTNACDVCSCSEQKLLFSKHNYSFVECAECRHQFVPFQGTDEELFKTYENNFFSDGGYADYEADKPVLQKNFARFIKILHKHRPQGRLFEVGCAYGFFLELAQKHWQAEGIDIQQEAVAYARRQLGVHASCGDFLKRPVPENNFDVVAMWDTIEHLRNPSDYVKKTAEILKPGGILALTTGDVGSPTARLLGTGWRLYYPPEHLHYFSRRTIARLLDRSGLKIVQIRHVGFHRSMEMMLYRSLYDRKPAWSQKIYNTLKRLGMTAHHSVYLNLFDIMMVIAVKKGPA